jgi:hypothetical protein
MFERRTTSVCVAVSLGLLLVATGGPAPEAGLVSAPAAAVAQSQARAGTLALPPPVPARRLAEATPAADLPPLAAEKHPPPVVNYVPPKLKRSASDPAGKKSDAKSKEKAKVKKAAPRKSKAVTAKPKSG